jgi:hypothetical protein
MGEGETERCCGRGCCCCCCWYGGSFRPGVGEGERRGAPTGANEEAEEEEEEEGEEDGAVGRGLEGQSPLIFGETERAGRAGAGAKPAAAAEGVARWNDGLTEPTEEEEGKAEGSDLAGAGRGRGLVSLSEKTFP